MKTKNIMTACTYKSLGGPIKAVPVSDVLDFLKRIQNRFQDLNDQTVTMDFFKQEIQETVQKLSQ